MVRRPILLVPIVLFFLSTGSLFAQFPLDQDDLLQDRGEYSPPWFAEMQDLELVGDRLFEYGVGGFVIFDISNHDDPIELGRYDPPGSPINRFYRGAVNGNLACGGGREDLLSILDITDHFNPQRVALHGVPGQSYEGAAMQGDFIFACRHDQGFEVINISDPANPVTESEITSLTNSWDLALTGSHAFVADGAGGLAVVDITNPVQPVHLTSVSTSGPAVDVDVEGTTAVVCVGSGGIDIFDISTPSAPVLSGSANTSGLAMTAALVGNLVYVADWDDVEIFDIGNPANPIRIGGEDTPVRAMGLDARDGLVAVADWSRLRLYTPGPTTQGDLQVSVESIDFGFVPVGAIVDTTFTLGNTGGGPINVSLIELFSYYFTILDPGPFTILPGETRDIGLRFNHEREGYEATFIKITSDDTDEAQLTFPIQADDSPVQLAIGEIAPDFSHVDVGGVTHTLSQHYGKVVVLAFFANW